MHIISQLRDTTEPTRLKINYVTRRLIKERGILLHRLDTTSIQFTFFLMALYTTLYCLLAREKFASVKNEIR